MTDAYIVAAKRTPSGRRKGTLSSVRGDHLGAVVLQSLCTETGLDAGAVDDVIFGNVTQIGEQSANVARTALLSAGWPQSVPGLTIDRKCGSSEVAVHIAAGMVGAGANALVAAGGVENMTRVPMGSNRDLHGEAIGWKLLDRYDMVNQGEAAERIADKWSISRDELDTFAVESQTRAARAAANGWYDREIVPVELADWAERGADPGGATRLAADETIRAGTDMTKLASLKTSFREDGRITAGNSSQVSDGAAALMIASTSAIETYGLKSRARIRAFTSVGSDPELVLTGPLDATRSVLDKAGLSLADIDLFEVNEAFASVPIMWMREFGISHDKLNVNGGAIALGHPLGASGARVMTTLLHELERRDLTFGLQTFCCNGGMGTACIIERVP
jgi:acetyl-CoA acyltransferase